MKVSGELRRGQRYTIWSYAPRPEPADLVGVEASYPAGVAPVPRDREDARRPVRHARDAERRSTRSSRTSATSRSGRTAASGARRADSLRARGRRTARLSRSRRGCARRAASSTTSRRHSPGRAAAARPLHRREPPRLLPALRGRDGADASFPRHPARVAAGFTSGKYENGGWTVTDHNAHTWVEVWFPDYGWLAFDPTPGRGSLAANYSASSPAVQRRRCGRRASTGRAAPRAARGSCAFL